MSHRRRQPRPKWQLYAGIAAAVAVIAGGAALASAAASGGSGSGSGTDAAAHAAGTPGASGGPSAGPTGSGSASPSASAKPSGSASPTASATASAGASAPTTRPPAKATTAPAGPARQPGPAHPASAAVFTGLAFDTCTAPSASTMSAWRAHSPYGAAAVYIGGRNRGCAQPQLTSSWVRTVSAAGWKLVPIYVGAQPPCQSGGNPERLTAATAASLGASDGSGAVADAQALGMRAGSAVYLDMEAYDSGDTACVNAVLTYIQAWDRALHAHGYWAGFYGFTSSSAAAVAQAAPSTPDMPDALWYAKYDGNDSTTAGFPFAGSLWTGHRRGHQYKVNSRETYGGATVTVDRDAWDAPVAVVG